MRRLLVVPVVLAFALTACGGGDGGSGGDKGGEAAGSPDPGASSSPAHALAGTYDVTSVVDRTELKGKGNTKGTKDQLTLVVGCADEDCSKLLMRGSVPNGALSRTVALTAADDSATGERVRTGPCTQASGSRKPGEFRETSTYTLTPDGDDLSGEVEYVFKGCGFDGTSHLALTGTRTDESVPYLPSAAVESLAGPVTDYDAAVGKVYAGYNGCYDGPDPETAACLVGLLDPWAGTFPAVEDALAGARGGGSACTKALDALHLEALEKKVAATVRGLKASGATRQEALAKDVPALVDVLSTTHQNFVTTLALCVDPEDMAELGDEGTLAMDVDARLPTPSS